MPNELIEFHKIYTLGICNNEKILASIVFITFNKKNITESFFIEEFVNRAGVILQKKIAELNLKESEERFKTILNLSPAIISILDETGKIIYNSAIENQLLGYNKRDLTNLNIFSDDFIHPEDRNILKNSFGKVLLNPDKIIFTEFRAMTVYGYVWFETASKNYLQNPAIRGILVTMKEITTRKISELKLKQSEEKLKEIFDNSLDNIFVVDVCPNDKFRINTINAALEKVLKTSKTNIEGKYFEEILDKKYFERILKNYKKCLSERKNYTYEEFADLPAGIIYYSTNLIPIFDDFDNIVRIIGISRNITERKKAEISLLSSENQLKALNHTKDKLFSIIAHDLRSPFNSILGFSEMMLEDGNEFEPERIMKFLSLINSTTKNTLVLLDNLLNWANSQTGQIHFNPENVFLGPIIKKTIEILKPSAKIKNISLLYSQTNDLIVCADLNMINTILRNLISNSIKYTNQGGRVNVLARQIENQIEITISDTGVGMSQETIDQLFNINTNISTNGTANEKGSGLGLILCKEFIVKHGGKIRVESEQGKGSNFIFTLPLCDKQVN